jgi:EmrB/QacA subfamily drug resistance transporter
MLHHISMRQKVIVMISVMAAMFLVALDQTIMSTALGKIVEEFKSFDSLSWVVTAYLLTSTVTVPIAGKLSDVLGRRAILIFGVAVFTIGSLLSGSAGNIEQLILWRAVQGIGGGIVMTNAFTIIGDLFAPRERGKWQGMIGGIFSLASVVGPVLGGFLTDGQTIAGLTTDWRWTLWINVPIGIATLVMIALYCPRIKHEHKPVIDYAGAGFIAVALSSLVLAVENTELIFGSFIADTGIEAWVIKTALYVLSAVATLGFILVEKRAKEPIMPLNFFKNRVFSTTMVVALLVGAAFLGAILYLTQFNQQVFGAGATEAGLMLLPLILSLTVAAIVTGQVTAKTGKYKMLLVGGLAVSTIGLLALITLNPDSSYWYEALLMVATGLGIGVSFPILNIAVQNEFSQKDLGVATSASQLFRSLGSTVGVAVLGGVLTAGVASGLGDIKKDAYIQMLSQQQGSQQIVGKADANTALNLNTAETKESINKGLEEGLKQSNLPAPAQDAVKKQVKSQQDAFSDRVVKAFADGLRPVFAVSAALMGAAALVAMTLKNVTIKHDGPNDAPGVAAAH